MEVSIQRVLELMVEDRVEVVADNMKKKYYISDRITGVYFLTRNKLKDYYKRATKIEDMSCGKITVFETSSGLEEHIKRNRTHKNHIWNLG